MAKKNAAKMAPKKEAVKMAEKPVMQGSPKAPAKKGLPVIPIIVGIIVVIIAGGWLFLNSLNDSLEDVDFGVPEVGIDVLDSPIVASEGEEITVTWRVLGTTVDSSELVYSQLPKGGFGDDFDVSTLEVDGSGYEGMIEGQSAESDFEGQVFSANLRVEYSPLFMRIHAKSGETNYWTDELVVLGE
jgi:hypothetical protein